MKCQNQRWLSGRYCHPSLSWRVFKSLQQLGGFAAICCILSAHCSAPSSGLSSLFPFASWTKKKNACTYIHIQKHTCIFKHIHTYTRMIQSYTYIWTYVILCVCYLYFACMCMHCTYLYVYACIWNIGLCRYIHMHTIHTHTDICTLGYKYTHMHILYVYVKLGLAQLMIC